MKFLNFKWSALFISLALLAAIVFVPDIRLALMPLLTLAIEHLVRKAKPQ